jgi:hypothetical protein
MTRIVSGMLMVALVSACGGTSTGADPLVGTWACMGKNTVTYTMPATMAPKTNSFTATVTITDNGDGTITADSVNGNGGTCTLTSTVRGSSYSLETNPPQSCTNNGVTNTYTSGGGTLSADGMTITRSSSFTVSGTNLAGSGTGASTCTRM